jgi:hypothetical protein
VTDRSAQTALAFAPARPARQPKPRKPSSQHAPPAALVRTVPCSIGLADCATNDAWCTAHPDKCGDCGADHADRDDAGNRSYGVRGVPNFKGTRCTDCYLAWVLSRTQCPAGCGGLTPEGSAVFGEGFTCRCARNAWIASLRDRGAL